MPETTGRWDAIVIGSGLGGLTAAAYLSAAGKKTLLLERFSVLGGSSHVFRRRGRWEFDVGVHYMGDCGPDGQVPRVLRGLALDDAVGFREMDRDGFDTVIAPDMELRIPADWDQFQANLIEVFPADRRPIGRYIRTLRRLSRGVDHSVTCASRHGHAALARSAGIAAPWIMTPHFLLLSACGLSPRAMQVLSVYSGGYASTPMAAPVGMQAGYVASYVDGGAWYPEGGGQALAAGLVNVITSHGGTIRTHAEVNRIVVENGRVAGVQLADGETVRCPVVLSDIDIARTYRDLVGVDHLPWWMARRVRSYTMAWPFFTAYFGVSRDLRTAPNTNYYVIPTWQDATSVARLATVMPALITRAHRRDPLDWAHDYAARMIGFVHSGTTRDPGNLRSAPPGCGALEVLSIAPRDLGVWGLSPAEVADGSYRANPVYREVKDILIDGMRQRMEQAMPGISADIVFGEASTPATQDRFTGTLVGSGLEPRVSQFGVLRPRPRTVIPGLFLAGTSTAWGPGTVGATLSGMHAAGAILDRDLDAEVRSGVVVADRDLLADIAHLDPLRVCTPGLARPGLAQPRGRRAPVGVRDDRRGIGDATEGEPGGLP